MKKFVAFFAAVVVLMSLLALSVSAEQTCQEVTIPKFTAKPTFDGVISVEEWGEPTVHVVTDGAATAEDNAVGRNDEYGLINTFYWFAFEDSDMDKNFYYDLWLRWDEEYFYLAAKVNDPNPFSQPSLWDGDKLEFIVDVKGPSTVMLKSNPEFNYKVDSFLGARYTKPWSSDKIFAAVVSLVNGKTPTLWHGKSEWNIVTEGGGMVGITTTDNGDGVTCTNVFEVAVPWSVIASEKIGATDRDNEFVPQTGDVYGITAVVGSTDSKDVCAWLQWGHGICYVSPNSIQPRGTRGGSQAMVLGSDAITPAAEYDKYVETTEIPTTEVTETLAENTTLADTTAPEEDATETEKTEVVTTKIPVTDSTADDGSTPTGLVIGIAVAAVAVIAVIIIIVKKKK